MGIIKTNEKNQMLDENGTIIGYMRFTGEKPDHCELIFTSDHWNAMLKRDKTVKVKSALLVAPACRP